MRQSGSAKVMLPRTHSGVPEIVFLNTSGGLTSGDRLEYSVTLGAGTRARATTQTAERAYRAGAVSYLEWAQLQSERTNARKQQLEAALEAQRALIEIQRLTGQPFVAGAVERLPGDAP